MQTVVTGAVSVDTAISADNYSFLQTYIHQESGIVIDPNKSYLLVSRLQPIVKENSLGTLNDLCRLLRATTATPIKRQVIEALTTNETLFFRDMPVFEALQKEVLPAMIKAKQESKRIRIWSAAASSGQEAYSLAMLLLEMGLSGWNLQILGTDLNRQILDKATAGKYLQIEVNRGMPAKYLVKYFTRAGLDWQINDRLRPIVSFQQFDMRSPLRALGKFDLVLCRNVLIYFDLETKKKILKEIRGVMEPGAHLILGTAETTLNIDDAYQRAVFGGTSFYTHT
ncbi:MAG: protein-glutamate O-methyltransferase CheR [Acidobacteria bacterium]|nr:protein-glutamate O-methyltransferase CheR [Acidobacteriota bacterium]